MERFIFTLGLCANLLLLPCATGYLPEETECPEAGQIENDFFFARPWVPPGTPFRSMLTLPPAFDARMSAIPGRGIGIHTKTFIRGHTWLSEYEGEYIPIEEADDRPTYDYSWRVQQDGEDDRIIDAREESLSNWLRYINCGRHISEENVEMTMCYGRIFFITTKNISPGTELLIYCGDDYVSEYLDTNRDNYYGSKNETG